MNPKFRAWDKRFSEFVEDFFVSEDGKIYKKTKDTSYGFAISRETSDKIILMQQAFWIKMARRCLSVTSLNVQEDVSMKCI